MSRFSTICATLQTSRAGCFHEQHQHVILQFDFSVKYANAQQNIDAFTELVLYLKNCLTRTNKYT